MAQNIDVEGEATGENEGRKPEESDSSNIPQYVNNSQLANIGFNNVTDEMVKELNKTLKKYDIITKNQIAHFLAQFFVETWRGNGLIEINWRDYPDKSKDREYFNERYGNNQNLGNRGKNTNDGYNYRGSGYIHLTGRYNYQQFANAMNDQNIMQGANYVAENYAWEAAGWFWTELKKINEKITPSTTVRQITRIVNGGYNDLDKKEEAYTRAVDIFKE